MDDDDSSYEQMLHEKLKLLLIIIGWSMSQYADPADLYEAKEAGENGEDEIDS